MQLCQNCNQENPDDVPVCLNCASSLAHICPSCGTRMPKENRFCGQCGEKLGEFPPPQDSPDPFILAQQKMLSHLQAKMPSTMVNKISRDAPEMIGQRREVTVLFVDIVDYPRVSHELGSEKTYLVVDEIMHVLTDIVYKYEGTIDNFSGYGLMALFGIPINHENDPERAVRASLDMHTEMATLRNRLSTHYNFNFNIRIGINTGPVIAGSMRNNHHMEYTVIGDTVNIAAQLDEIADPGATLVSFQTYQRTRPVINYQSNPIHQLDGVPDLPNSYLALSLRVKPGQTRGLPGLQVPIVGRREDIANLFELFEKSHQDKKNGVVLCSGDAGIGKTRLVTEFGKGLAGRQVEIYQGTCASYMRITPYRVVADLIRSMIHVSEMDSETYQQDSLRKYLETHELDVDEALPYLFHVLSLPQVDHVSEARLKLLDPDMLQRQTHSVLRKFFVAQVERFPILLIFDDLHWVDQASRDFLVFFCQSVINSPLFIILIARDFERDGMLQPLVDTVRKEAISSVEINLEPLSVSDSRLLADQLIQETTTYANKIKQQMTDRARGNPYFTEEMVRVLIDQGGIVLQHGNWRVTHRAIQLIEEVPGTLTDIILARFDRLQDEARKLLQRAAVFGQSFPVRLLQIFSGGNEEDNLAILRDLENRDYLIRSQFGIEEECTFKHPLLQCVIYNTLLQRDRIKLHRKLGEIIENDGYWLPAEQDDILAYHFDRGEQPEKAVVYLIASAEKAAKRFANESVIQHYCRVIEIMESMGDTDSERYDRANVRLGQAYKFSGAFEKAVKVLMRPLDKVLENLDLENPKVVARKEILVEGLRELGDLRSREGNLDLAESLLLNGLRILGPYGEKEFSPQWRRLVDRLAWVYFRQGKLEEAFNQADLALFDLDTWEVDDPITLASLSNTLGGIYWTRSRNIDAILNVDRSLKIYQSLNYAWGMAIALTNLGVLHFSMGKWPEAIANLDKADGIQKDFGYFPERPTNLKNLGEVLICIGDHARAREKLYLGWEIAQNLGMNIAEAYIEMGLCRLEIIEHNLEAACNHLERIQILLEPESGQVDERIAQMLVLSARVEILKGDLQKGLSDAEKAYQISEQGGFSIGKTEALRVLGIIESRMGLYEKSEFHLLNCVDLANDQNDFYRQAQGLFALGELYLVWSEKIPTKRQEILAKARNEINEALGLFEMLGAKNDLHKAQVVRNRIALGDSSQNTRNDRYELDDEISLMRTRLGLPDGEWYQAVILYIQIVGASDADIEFVFETITIFIPPLVDIFCEYDGHVIRHQDAMTVIFGAPIAHEDDPERAIEAAIKVVNFYQEFHNQTDLPLSIRLGISMGRIVAGFVGAESDREFIAAGEPVLEAMAIANAAPLSRVWVTEAVRNATTYRYEYASVSTDLTANHTDTIIHQLEGIREQIRPVRGLIGLKAPFVGRHAELAALLDISLNLDRHEGGLIWIEGDPGIGKSRLMREFVADLPMTDVQVWMGACAVRRTDYAFSLFSDLLGYAFDLQSTYPIEQIYNIIETKLRTWTTEADEIQPFIQVLCGVQPTGKQGEQLLNLEPEQLRRQTFVAVRKVVEAVANTYPLVMILDDIQWIDPVSAELLLFLTSLILDHPVLIISAKRSRESSKALETLNHIQRMHPDKTLNLMLQPLSPDDCNLLLDKFFVSADISESVNKFIVQQSGGNPYYIEEFIRMLVEQGYMQVIRGQLEINQTFEIDTLSVPTSLESLIRARVDALQTPIRNLLQVASVIGQRFHKNLLEWISGQKEIENRLTLLQNRGMLQGSGEDDYWEFSHPLIEAVVYHTVLKAQRKILHLRTANALEIQWRGNEEEHAEDLAYHFRMADELNKALNYLVLAGERSANRHANESALEYFEEAAKLINQLPATNSDLRFRVALGLGEVYQFVGNFESSLNVLLEEEARGNGRLVTRVQRANLYRCIGETVIKKGDTNGAIAYLDKGLETLGSITSGAASASAAMLLERKGWTYFLEANLEEALKTGERAHYYAQRAGNLRALAKIENLLGGVFYRQGELENAVIHVQRAMQYWEEMGYTWGVAATLSNLGILEVAAGNWDSALDFFQQSLDLRREMGDVEGVVIAHNNLGTLAREKGDMPLAETHFRNCLSVAKPFQIAWHTANATMGVAQALLYQGKPKEAQVMLQEGIVLADEIGARDLTSEMGRTQAEIYLALNSPEAGFKAAKKAARLANEINNYLMEAGAWRVAAESLLKWGKPKVGLQILDKAWTALEKVDDELETGRVNAQASKIFFALGEFDRAHDFQQIAADIFTRLGADRDLAALKAGIRVELG